MFCSQHFIASADTRKAVFARLDETLNVPASRYQNDPPPPSNLRVFATIPRQLLIPSVTSDSPLLQLPTRPANTDVLRCLAAIFQGTSKDVTNYLNAAFPESRLPSSSQNRDAMEVWEPQEDSLSAGELNAARTLYTNYLQQNPRMWSDVVNAAETVAMLETALAAIDLIILIADTRWQSSTAVDATGDSDMSEPDAAPLTGIEALLTPPALTTVLPYLLRPPQTFSNLVGGRGDAEGAAYRIATQKFDALGLVHKRLVLWMEERTPVVEARCGELSRIEAALRERLRDGVWGGRGDAGGRIATLEL